MWKVNIFSDLNGEKLASIWKIADLVGNKFECSSELYPITENQSWKCWWKQAEYGGGEILVLPLGYFLQQQKHVNENVRINLLY